MKLNVLTYGAKSEQARQLQAALNRRLRARDMEQYVVAEDGVVGVKTLESVRKAAWILGALPETYDGVVRRREVSIGVQRLIRNPGLRTERQLRVARARLTWYRKHRKKTESAHSGLPEGRRKVVAEALQAAKNYEANPRAYRYLAGGIPNLIYLTPAPAGYRSDCSQFVSAVQHAAKLPDLGPNGPLWVNTWVMDEHLRQTSKPIPGDFGMYGPPGDPHHVELYCALPGYEFIGHGSAAIDAVTPGRPTYYLENPIR